MAEVTKEGFLLKQQLIEEAKKGQQENRVTFASYEQKYKCRISKCFAHIFAFMALNDFLYILQFFKKPYCVSE